ncbi:hypothetical protein JJB09_26405 [Rhizobium sp. KVB221]|uniref:Uncharacterized protein n=1 Tax=Rhizobium setariae TaxID=2801340 RepID=A0A936YRP3_9HYPH|nr:hypothetical protein [Rhizobium setariae]MBL0375535.1 hypothetical protein [Rhizobium setariae]
MTIHAKLDPTSQPVEYAETYDDPVLDRQRGGYGVLSNVLFPLISIAAVLFAAYELFG